MTVALPLSYDPRSEVGRIRTYDPQFVLEVTPTYASFQKIVLRTKRKSKFIRGDSNPIQARPRSLFLARSKLHLHIRTKMEGQFSHPSIITLSTVVATTVTKTESITAV